MGNNIVLPYSGQIPGGIEVGTDVTINGRIHPNCSRFSINLCLGPTYNEDTAFHFNPRFDANQVVRNHKQGGNWGAEEKAGHMPFHKGQNFDLHMKVTKHGYKVTVNNRHFCDFNHRLPKESVKYIYIEGQVTINFIQFQGGHHHHHGSNPVPSYPSGPCCPPASNYPTGQIYPPAPSFPSAPGYPAGGPAPPGYPAGGPAPPGYPAGCPAPPGYPAGCPAPPGYPAGGPAPPAYTPGGFVPPGYPAGGAAPAGPIQNPPVPFTTLIPGGLQPGKIIYITGIPNPNPSRFSVNLACGPSEMGDIGLTFDMRFNYGTDKNQTVRNHKQGGAWGQEERQQNYFPCSPNTNFQIMILTEPTGFKIAVNGQHFCEFYHRIQPFQKNSHLIITGDVRLTEVRFQ